MIFEQAIEVMASLPSVEERLKFLQDAKKEEATRFDMVIGDLKKEKITQDQLQKAQEFSQGSIGEPVVTGEDSLNSAFSDQMPLT